MQRDQTHVRPNLFIIGAMKSGTTTLHSYVGAHPDAFMSNPKEPSFFVPEMTYYPKREDWYLGLFAGASGAHIVGESSTDYTTLPVHQGVPARIAAFCDEPRMIYIMRDPIERAISHYWHIVRQLRERRSMTRAFRDDVPYIAFGDYSMQLAPWLDTFGRERILCLSFEELVSDPKGTVATVYKWLGLSTKVPFPDSIRKNARPPRLKKVRLGLLHRATRSAAWDKLAQAVPSPLKELGRRVAYSNVAPDEYRVAKVIEQLRPRMIPRVRALERLLGREFTEWTTTFGYDRKSAGPLSEGPSPRGTRE